ncbi:MAG: hypothetical protein MET45_29635 [Nostoc sp. LLA-1]|nr:hypothetical protein [Cyanocohniella sp. LLY]
MSPNYYYPTQQQRSDRSWTVSRAEIGEKNLDLKAVNPNTKIEQDASTLPLGGHPIR